MKIIFQTFINQEKYKNYQKREENKLFNQPVKDTFIRSNIAFTAANNDNLLTDDAMVLASYDEQLEMVKESFKKFLKDFQLPESELKTISESNTPLEIENPQDKVRNLIKAAGIAVIGLRYDDVEKSVKEALTILLHPEYKNQDEGTLRRLYPDESGAPVEYLRMLYEEVRQKNIESCCKYIWDAQHFFGNSKGALLIIRDLLKVKADPPTMANALDFKELGDYALEKYDEDKNPKKDRTLAIIAMHLYHDALQAALNADDPEDIPTYIVLTDNILSDFLKIADPKNGRLSQVNNGNLDRIKKYVSELADEKTRIDSKLNQQEIDENYEIREEKQEKNPYKSIRGERLVPSLKNRSIKWNTDCQNKD